MRALGAAMRRRGFGYVVALTVIVALSGAAQVESLRLEVAALREELRAFARRES